MKDLISGLVGHNCWHSLLQLTKKVFFEEDLLDQKKEEEEKKLLELVSVGLPDLRFFTQIRNAERWRIADDS